MLNCDRQVVAREKEEGAALWKHRTQVRSREEAGGATASAVGYRQMAGSLWPRALHGLEISVCLASLETCTSTLG